MIGRCGRQRDRWAEGMFFCEEIVVFFNHTGTTFSSALGDTSCDALQSAFPRPLARSWVSIFIRDASRIIIQKHHWCKARVIVRIRRRWLCTLRIRRNFYFLSTTLSRRKVRASQSKNIFKPRPKWSQSELKSMILIEPSGTAPLRQLKTA